MLSMHSGRRAGESMALQLQSLWGSPTAAVGSQGVVRAASGICSKTSEANDNAPDSKDVHARSSLSFVSKVSTRLSPRPTASPYGESLQ